MFKIEHIKDFKILEKPNTMLVDPAIISVTEKPASELFKLKTAAAAKEEEKDGGFYEPYS